MTDSKLIRIDLPFKAEVWTSYNMYVPHDFDWETMTSKFSPEFNFEEAKEAAIEEALWGDNSLEVDTTEVQWEFDDDALQQDINYLKEQQQLKTMLSATVKYNGEKLVFFNDPHALGIKLIEFLAKFKKSPIQTQTEPPLLISDGRFITINPHTKDGMIGYTIIAPKHIWKRAEIALNQQS